MSVSVQIAVNESLYLRDPQETKLGRNIILNSIQLIDEVGLESFTFKKLANRMGSTEASIYRYFENKHLLLLYLLSWYWEWLNFRIDFNSMNVHDPREKLSIVIRTIADTIRLSIPPDYVDRDTLHRIVVAEGTKAYHIKAVDEENNKGFFLTYKRLSKKIAGIISAINPSFCYPNTLASNLLEMGNNQLHFAQHLPALTDIKVGDGDMEDLIKMMEHFAFSLIDSNR